MQSGAVQGAGQGAATGSALGPYGTAIGAGAGLLAGSLASGGKSRKSPIEGDLMKVVRPALAQLSSQIPGASSLATSSTQAYSGLLGAGGPYSGLSAIGPLEGLIATGSPTDISPVVSSTIAKSKQQIEDQAKALQEQFASSGVRSGGDVIRGSALLRERGAVDLGDVLTHLAYASEEAARGRQLGAIGTAQNLFGGARQDALSTLQSASGMNIPSRLPSTGSELIASLLPAAAYGYASKSGGKNTQPATSGG